MSHHQQRHDAALLRHQYVESAAGRTRIHDLETDTGAQELGSKGRGREDLALSGSQQNEFWIECEDARRIEAVQILHPANIGRLYNRGGADDDGAAIGIVVDA